MGDAHLSLCHAPHCRPDLLLTSSSCRKEEGGQSEHYHLDAATMHRAGLKQLDREDVFASFDSVLQPLDSKIKETNLNLMPPIAVVFFSVWPIQQTGHPQHRNCTVCLLTAKSLTFAKMAVTPSFMVCF